MGKRPVFSQYTRFNREKRRPDGGETGEKIIYGSAAAMVYYKSDEKIAHLFPGTGKSMPACLEKRARANDN